MRLVKYSLVLLMCVLLVPAHAQKKKKQDPALKGPFFILPYLDAFGMRVWELDRIPEISKGSISVFEHQIVRDYTFFEKKESSTSIKYEVKGSGFGIDHIFFHVYRIFPTLEETKDFVLNEIPADWEEISMDELKEHTGNTVGISSYCHSTYTNMAKCYRLPRTEGKPAVYAGATLTVWPYKKGRFQTVVGIHYWEEKPQK